MTTRQLAHNPQIIEQAPRDAAVTESPRAVRPTNHPMTPNRPDARDARRPGAPFLNAWCISTSNTARMIHVNLVRACSSWTGQTVRNELWSSISADPERPGPGLVEIESRGT